MRCPLLVMLVISGSACSSEDVGKRAEAATVDPADYNLTLAEAQKAIEAHAGPGCLRMFPYVACRGCAPKYRLDPIGPGIAVGPCARATFVAGPVVQTANADPGKPFTWTCEGGATGGSWSNGAIAHTGALVCRD